MTTRFAEQRIHRVVRNDQGRLAVWPADRDLPNGWTPTGVRGRYEECIRQIDSAAARHSGSHAGTR